MQSSRQMKKWQRLSEAKNVEAEGCVKLSAFLGGKDMNENYTIKSKINVKPKKMVYVFRILLNLCMVLVLFSGIVLILFDGFSIRKLGVMAMAVMVVSLFKSKPSNSEHYEFAFVDVGITKEKIVLTYRQLESYKSRDVKVVILCNEIEGLEYSDQLCCLHIFGVIRSEVIGVNNSRMLCRNHYLYIEHGMEDKVVSQIHTVSGIPVKYMDR